MLNVGIIEKYKDMVCCVYLDDAGKQHVVVTQEAAGPAGNQQLSSRLQVRRMEEVLDPPAKSLLDSKFVHVQLPALQFA